MLGEAFTNPQGSWEGYDTYDANLRTILQDRKHVDIRDFESGDKDAPRNVLELSKIAVDDLDGIMVSILDEPYHVILAGEHWSAGISIVLGTHNFWPALSLDCPTGTTTTFSVTDPIDLLTGFENDDFISLALPTFPHSKVTQASSFIDFTSHPTGNFTTGPTASVALSATTIPLVAGNSEFRVLRSAFNQNGINLGAVTGVRFRIVTSSLGVVYLSALRLLSKTWKFGLVDFNTRRETLMQTVAPSANPAAVPEFQQPIVWRSAEVPGENDPRPIDFNVAVGFYTGSLQASNVINVYGRELTEDFLQQIDLNALSMEDLNGQTQPDTGDAAYDPRLQTDLGEFDQDQLQGLDQLDLERTPDYLSASWIQFSIQWTGANTLVAITNTEGQGYSFNLATPLDSESYYVAIFELKDTAARAAIFPLGPRDQIIYSTPVFDSTLIDDDFIYKRRKGRFGWHASLGDGDAYIESIRSRSTSYAEYRSLPYESVTPVVGAELTADSSPVTELFLNFVPTDTTGISIERDNEISVSGESYRVTDYGTYTFQGIESNEFEITDFDQTEILLDIFYPTTSDDSTLEFYLKSGADHLIPLPRPKIYQGQWQTIRLRVPSAYLIQTGPHRLVIVQSRPANTNWWVDKVRIFERTVSWHGRAAVEDPWAATEDDWTPFQNALNRVHGGILFQGRANRLQVKAVGHQQDAKVNKVQFKPKYAEIGRFVWPDEALTDIDPPVASYSTSNSGRVYTFNGLGSSDPDGQVVGWYWTVSDGATYYGPVIQHTFGAAGTYSVSLTAIDRTGLMHSTSADHSVA
jgi:hypothetical protein